MDRMIEHEMRLEEWSQRIIRQKESGLTVKQWCTVNNVTTHTYYYWLKKLKCRAFETQDALNEPVFAPLPVSLESNPINLGEKVTIKSAVLDLEMNMDTFLKYAKQLMETLSC